MRHVMKTEEWFKLASMHQLWLACIPPFLSVCHPAEVDHSNARIFIAALLLLLLRHRRYFISGVILVHLRSFRNILWSLLAAKWLHIQSRKFYVQPCNPFANLLRFHSDFAIFFFPSDVFFPSVTQRELQFWKFVRFSRKSKPNEPHRHFSVHSLRPTSCELPDHKSVYCQFPKVRHWLEYIRITWR